MMRRYLRSRVHEALDRREAAYEELNSEAEITAYQRRMRQFFVDQLGGFPERTPLGARVVGSKRYDDYRIEKVIYESRPRFYVTAVLYLPLSEPPYPGILLPCGHSENGKAAEAYQRACILLAKNGMAVLCPDPIGQGERKQLLDGGRGRFRSTTEHMVDGVAPILLGMNLASYMIWDEMRGIDYLVSRNEIDPSRIGCTGNSGGGNRTSYLMALDERIAAAAPACFITTTRRKNESPGPGDAEQNIHAQIARGMDHADYILMRAPRPTLVCSATRDYVPIEGAWESFREAKRLYARLGYAERVDLIETDEKHGFSTHLRVGATRWMQRWLLHEDDAVTDEAFPVEPDPKLQCTPDGQVLLIKGARSIFDLNVEKERQLSRERSRIWAGGATEGVLSKVRSIAGIRKLDDLPTPDCENRGTLRREGYRIDKLVLRPEREIALPGLLFVPEQASGESYLYVHGGGKHVDAGPGGPIEGLLRAGHVVLAVDLRGCGETRTTPWRYRAAESIIGAGGAEFFIAYMLGKSFVGMRAEDVLAAARFLAEHGAAADTWKPIHVVAVGEAGPPAVHAVALEKDLFDSLTLRRSLISWSSAVHTPVTENVLAGVVHGALTTYDLPDLLAAIGPDRVTVEQPVDASGRPISP